jgi:glycosyltransferase involved in cell wall biosynthesis
MKNQPKIAILRANSYRSESRLIKTHETLEKIGKCYLILWNRDNKITKHSFVKSLNIKAPFGKITLLFYMPIWFIFCFNQLRKIKPQIIHACDLETIIPAVFYSWFFKTKIVYDIYDVTADKINLHGSLRNFFLAIEKFYIRKANWLIVPDEERIDQLKLKKFRNVEIIYNSDLISNLSVKKMLNFKNQKTIQICYIGTLIEKIRGLEFILNIAKKFENKINFIIAGYGPSDKYFDQAFSNYFGKNIKFLGRISHEKASEINGSTDIMISLLDPNFSNYKYATSTKIFEAFRYLKPIITTGNTASGKLVKKTNWGLAIPYSEKALYENLENIINGKITFNLDSEKTKQYSWQTMEKRLLKIYRELINSN